MAFTATLTSARLSTLGARMDTAQPTLEAARAIEAARPTMADAAETTERNGCRPFSA